MRQAVGFCLFFRLNILYASKTEICYFSLFQAFIPAADYIGSMQKTGGRRTAMMNDDGLRPNDVALGANDGMIIKIPKSYPKDLGICITSAADQAAEGAERPAVCKLEQAGGLSVIERTAGIDDGGTQGAVRRAGDHHSA